MAALNCVMLSPAGDPVPLPSEKFLFSCRPHTISLSLFPHPPGADFSVQPKRGQEYKQNHGTLHVSQKRIVYVAAGATADAASASIGPTSGAAAGSLALGQASIAPDTSSATAPDKVPLMTLSIPLRYFVDGHLVQPWFGANYYEALCIEGDGAGDLAGPHVIRLYFKEGGGYEFYTAVEEVKARADLQQHSRGRDTPVEQLPAYTAANGESDPSASTSSSSPPPPTPSALLPPPPPALVLPRTAPSPADLAAAETARAAEEAERLQLAPSSAAVSDADRAAVAPTLAPQAGEAPPGYSA